MTAQLFSRVRKSARNRVGKFSLNRDLCSRRWALAIACALLISQFTGCGGGNAASQGNSVNLRILVMSYNAATRSLARKPQSEEELRNFIESSGMKALERSGISSVDELFVSDRDGKPFVVFYQGNTPQDARPDIVAYEQEGLEGTRLVATDLGAIEKVEEAAFSQMVPTSPTAQ